MSQSELALPTARRTAPHGEWVEMYRRGIAPSRIAVLHAAPVTTVRFHLQVAKKLEPGLEAEHKKALPQPARPSAASLQTMQNVVAFCQAAGRLPSARAKSPNESMLGRWLYRRRQEALAGTLSPAIRDGLDVIPGWDLTTRRKADDEARWQKRLQQVRTIRDAGGDWPRHQKTPDPDERILGVWLHGQRINYRQGRLAPEKESLLNELVPGWREGRRGTSGRR
ncbi:helicase-associated (plasmid) [Pseudarthrobacter chlorophenolicus A6]|uniref:Helicase-associated n=2 Tax=Pseudarthrobacter chlorophenolicus TaxID=85085 RepID=B8HJI0_PSECP|nr:helicase-associated [Pseudarthrobacter chlorophenolicus A6]SDQ09221.1 Helicase associated domain-containing protein [Pseudarthrobacter chlorophenolicus]